MQLRLKIQLTILNKIRTNQQPMSKENEEERISFAELAQMLNKKTIGVGKKKRKTNGKNKTN